MPVSPSLGDELVTALTSYGFSGCVSYRTGADISAYGLSDPLKMTVAYTASETVTDSTSGTSSTVTRDASWTLFLGSADESGTLYAKTSDSDLVYTSLYSGTLSLLSGGDLAKIRPAELVVIDPASTDAIEFSAGGSKLKVLITHGDSGEVYSDASGAELDYTGYAALADLLAATAASSNTAYVEADPAVISADPVFSAVFTFGENTSALTLTPYSQNYFRASFLDRDDQLVTREDAEALIAALAACLD